ncbi:hypothetical protein Mapa_008248 [Marchantia paleacea]|nr:hypothetical protein Mapa_008248 [Marchantia paleacea]
MEKSDMKVVVLLEFVMPPQSSLAHCCDSSLVSSTRLLSSTVRKVTLCDFHSGKKISSTRARTVAPRLESISLTNVVLRTGADLHGGPPYAFRSSGRRDLGSAPKSLKDANGEEWFSTWTTVCSMAGHHLLFDGDGKPADSRLDDSTVRWKDANSNIEVISKSLDLNRERSPAANFSVE